LNLNEFRFENRLLPRVPAEAGYYRGLALSRCSKATGPGQPQKLAIVHPVKFRKAKYLIRVFLTNLYAGKLVRIQLSKFFVFRQRKHDQNNL